MFICYAVKFSARSET